MPRRPARTRLRPPLTSTGRRSRTRWARPMFEATLPCLRCSVLRTIEISEDVQTDEVTLDVEGGGLVTCICRDCLTGAEALAIARKSAVTLLNVTEDLIARIEYVWEILPHTKD